jgi:hypothetical protein
MILRRIFFLPLYIIEIPAFSCLIIYMYNKAFPSKSGIVDKCKKALNFVDDNKVWVKSIIDSFYKKVMPLRIIFATTIWTFIIYSISR